MTAEGILQVVRPLRPLQMLQMVRRAFPLVLKTQYVTRHSLFDSFFLIPPRQPRTPTHPPQIDPQLLVDLGLLTPFPQNWNAHTEETSLPQTLSTSTNKNAETTDPRNPFDSDSDSDSDEQKTPRVRVSHHNQPYGAVDGTMRGNLPWGMFDWLSTSDFC